MQGLASGSYHSYRIADTAFQGVYKEKDLGVIIDKDLIKLHTQLEQLQLLIKLADYWA